MCVLTTAKGDHRSEESTGLLTEIKMKNVNERKIFLQDFQCHAAYNSPANLKLV